MNVIHTRIVEEYRQSLEPALLERWDLAMVEYDKVIRGNVERRRGAALSDEEWFQYRESPEASFGCSYQPGHPKSALFRRLLEGKAPLTLPPPCSYSYPWYTPITSDQPIYGIAVSFEGERASAMTLSEHAQIGDRPKGIGFVQIQQSLWTLLERRGDSAVVTYGEWAAVGYRWALDFVEQDVDEAEGFICCWHQKGKPRIQTRDELWAEATWHVMKRVNAMRHVYAGLPLEPAPVEEGGIAEEMVARADANWVLKAKYEAAKQQIEARQAKGLPALPDDTEIQQMIQAGFDRYLHSPDAPRSNYRVGHDGRLIATVWRLQRITPNNTTEAG